MILFLWGFKKSIDTVLYFLYETNGPIGIYEDENMKKDILKRTSLGN